MSVSYNS